MRIWTFGCSFTQFPWPTWADILIKEVEEKKHKGENWGRCGAGNLYIASKIWECNARNKFGPNDWVFVQWSGFTREDRYTGSGWSTPGNIFSQNVYNDKFVNDWANPKFYALRDCTLITSTRLALAQLGVNQLHWSMMPLTQTNSCNPSHKVDDVTEVVNLYDVNLDLPSMMEYLDLLDHGEIAAKKRLKTKWRNGEPVLAEWHPTPWEHEKYINECITPRVPWLSNSGISDSTKNFVNQWRERLTNETPPIILDNIGWITPRYGY